MRQTDLKPDPDGYYRRNFGFIDRGNGRRIQAKISLGRVKRTAHERRDRISAIWRRIEISAEQANERPVWDKLSLAIAKSIGKGETEFKMEPMGDDDPLFYIRLVDATSQTYPEATIRPADEALYCKGKETDAESLKIAEATERKMLAVAADLKAGVLEFGGNDRKYVDLLGDKTLYQALDACGQDAARPSRYPPSGHWQTSLATGKPFSSTFPTR